MKFPLFIATLLAFAVTACDGQKEAPPAPLADETSEAPAEQAPAPVEEVPMPVEEPAAEEPAVPAEEPAAPAEETEPAPAAN
ncbi:MAG: hypothetical protein FWF12_05045 [Betaproteobacteria bacterium]|nr:hypothetical protein [Betaproteobacteria bacterium]